MKASWSKVNKELLLVLSLFAIAGLLNVLVASNRMVLGFYVLPTLFSAYRYGRRHATLTACASVFIVWLLTYYNSELFKQPMFAAGEQTWFDIAIWGGTLVVIAYFTGTLYQRQERHLRELRDSYQGILLILQHMASDDKYSKNHPYRVSVCATRIAEKMELNPERVEDVRAAALLHDVEKLGISRELLYKAANLTESECQQLRRDGTQTADTLPGSLRRVIPIILAYDDLCATPTPEQMAQAPLEARIMQVADAYDSMASDRGAPKSPFETTDAIIKRAGVDLDARVVDALIAALGMPAKAAGAGQ